MVQRLICKENMYEVMVHLHFQADSQVIYDALSVTSNNLLQFIQ